MRSSQGFTPKAAKQLTKSAIFYSQPQHEWRMNARLRLELTSNLPLMRELYKMAGQNPQVVRQLLNDSERYVRQASAALRQPQQLQQMLNLPPNHPSIINNINHPLNPSNPNNLMLNPAMNLIFQQGEAVQASILEVEEEETAENQLQHDLLAKEELQEAAQQGLADNPELNPHKELGLRDDASPKEIEAACLSKLAETAPEPGKEHSHEFSKAAAATVMLGFGREDHEHQHEQMHDSHASMQHSVAAA